MSFCLHSMLFNLYAGLEMSAAESRNCGIRSLPSLPILPILAGRNVLFILDGKQDRDWLK